jgi:hypothetical protein
MPPWTSALKVATIGLGNVGDFEELVMMRNVSECFDYGLEKQTV